MAQRLHTKEKTHFGVCIVKHQNPKGKLFSFGLASTFALGLTPFLFNLVVDPYGMNNAVDLDLNKFKVSERADYPLWKMINFPKDGAEIVILGDSRARALREKIWKGLGLDAFNFAYGGATIDEIYDTFQHVKSFPKLKTLVVSLPLRSFDPGHRGGLNRVPEAKKLASNPVGYYSSWFVTKIGIRNLEERYPELFQTLRNFVPPIISGAKAADRKRAHEIALTDLLDREYCKDCSLPKVLNSVPHPTFARHLNLGLGRGYSYWGRLWTTTAIQRDLPTRFERQVRKNGANDWDGFQFSKDLWGKIEEIAKWSKDNDVQLVFVIPPTIVEMQERMAGFGFSDLNHRFRVQLAELAPVFDFDFNSVFTRDLKKFTDAYHFKAKPAHAMVGEITQFISQDKRVLKRAKKKRDSIICPIVKADTKNSFSDGITTVDEGISCRIWRWNDA